MTRILFLMVISTLLLGVLQAQPVPPIAVPLGTPTTVSGTIAQFNYGAEGEAVSFMIGNTLVDVRGGPLLLMRFQVGDTVQVNGYGSTTTSGFQVIEATSIANSTRNITFTVPQPGSETAYSGSGQVSQFNYAPRGEIDGFLLNDGTLVKIPPDFGATLAAVAPLGSTVMVTGYSHQSVLGRVIVDAQTINGQTVHIGPAPPAPGATPPSPAGPPPTPPL